MMQKTKEIWKRMEEVADNRKLDNEVRQIKQKLELATVRIGQVESMDEYNSISQEIQELQNEQKGIENEIRLRPRIETAVRNVQVKQIKDTYNQEFQPHYDKYVKLDKELKKQLDAFAKATEPIVKEMVAIEKLESSFIQLKMQSVGGNGQIIKLPIDTKQLIPLVHRGTGISRGVASTTANIINTIKRNWGANTK